MKKRLMKKRLKQALDKPYLCEVVDLWLPEGQESHYPFKEGDTVLMLGEIEQMPGHVAVSLKDGRVVFGYHVENFRKLSREEA
jgi:hypothetical protein